MLESNIIDDYELSDLSLKILKSQNPATQDEEWTSAHLAGKTCVQSNK